MSNGGEQKGGSGCLKMAGIGCLVVVIIVILLGVYVLRNIKEWAADFANTAITQAVDQSALPEDQKQAMTKRLDQLTEDYKDGRVTLEQIGQIGERLIELLPAAMALGFDAQYVQKSDLSEEEKQEGALVCQRFARGIVEESISESEYEDVADLVMEGDPSDDNRQMKEAFTDDEVREILAKMKEQADQAKVPDEPHQIDFTARFNDAVDAVVNAAPDEAPATQPSN